MMNRAIVLALLALTLNLSAATHTWTGGGANELWNNAANWSGGAPTAGEAAPVNLVFPGSILTTNNIVGLTVDSILFTGNAAVLHGSGGGTLTFRGAGGTNCFSSSFLFTSNTIAGTLPVTLLGSNYFSFTGNNNNLSILSVISGAGSVALDGDGHLYFGGTQANTATGKTLVMNGALYFQKSAGVDAVAGPVELSAGGGINSLRVQNANQIPNSVAVTVGLNCFLDVNADESLGNLTLAGGNVDATGALLTLAGNVSVSAFGSSSIQGRLSLGGATRSFNVVGGAALTITAAITNGSAASGITKSGLGTLTLSGTNDFTGAVSVTGGTLQVNQNEALGASAGGLTVNANCSLQLNSVTVGAEALTLNGALAVTGTNSWNGAVTLPNEVTMDCPNNSQLTLSGVVTGGGALTKSGMGTLVFSGNSANTHSGGVSVSGGTVRLNKTGVVALPGPLQVGAAGTVQLLQANQIGDTAAVSVNAGGLLDLNNFSDTIGSLAGNGTVSHITATLTTGGTNASTTFGGSIGGIGFTPLVKNGNGTFTLDGTNNCTGTTVVNAGTLAVSGRLTSAVSISAGATLTGSGQVGNVIANSGHVRPGNAVGTLTTGQLNLTNGASTVTFEINGPTAGVLYDQIVANGAVNLSNPSLALVLNTFGALSNQYVLIANDGSDPVIGTFNGLPEGTVITSGMVSLRLTYQGGTGNDVALVQTAAPPLPRITKITPQPGGAMLINATGLVNAVYFVDATASLPGTNWTVLNSVMANGAGALSYTDGAAPGFTNRFYRLRAQ